MKTPVEMQLRILDKMRENISENERATLGIEVYNPYKAEWINSPDTLNFNVDKYRIKIETITINGVEIPKSLSFDELKDGVRYYHVGASTYEKEDAEHTRERGISFYYTCPLQALEASKALFGITG